MVRLQMDGRGLGKLGEVFHTRVRADDAPSPYASSPVFDQDTLPPSLQHRHATKAGVWGVIRVIEGQLRLTYLDPPSEVVLDPQQDGLFLPEQRHFVTPQGLMKMQVDLYDQPPG